MLVGLVEKVSLGIATAVLFAIHRLAGDMLAAGMLDLMHGALFVVAWRATPTRQGTATAP